MKDKVKSIIHNHVEDLFIILGLLIIVGITFHVYYVIGWYLVGAIMVGIGIVLSIIPRIRGGDKQ